jgi:hypothetical protein
LPGGVEAIGVEPDPTTAAIAAALYPAADIRTESFADSRLPEGYVDLTVGNVPFCTTCATIRTYRGAPSITLSPTAAIPTSGAEA